MIITNSAPIISARLTANNDTCDATGCDTHRAAAQVPYVIVEINNDFAKTAAPLTVETGAAATPRFESVHQAYKQAEAEKPDVRVMIGL